VQLLVSVRSATEAARAVAGGAMIIDAKDPAAGSLGQLSSEALEAIRRVVPARLPVSAALGDVQTEDDLARALERVTAPVAYVKVGFRGVLDARVVTRLLERAVTLAGGMAVAPVLIAVAYADHARAVSLAPRVLAGLLGGTGAGGLLVDTCFKDDGHLFRHVTAAELSAIAAGLAALGQLLALGGSLAIRHLPLIRDTGAAILGVRGAACDGGRDGEVSVARVRALAAALPRSEALAVEK
jgi:uncharacterized protein (UPF0264 family)